MIVGCTIFFNEAWILDRTLRALRERVDKLIAVDGPYAAFPHQKHDSWDGSYKIAREYADILIPAQGNHWTDEVEKRNRYLQECREGDWVFVVDADEEMIGWIPKLRGDAYRIQIKGRKDGIPLDTFRVFQMDGNTHYRGTHHSVFQGDMLRNNQPMPMLETVHLIHHHVDRPPARANLKGPYMDWLKEHEREFREKWEPET